MSPSGGVTDADWDWTINNGNSSTQTYEVASSALMGRDPDYLEIICKDHAEWNYSTFLDDASYSGTHTLRFG